MRLLKEPKNIDFSTKSVPLTAEEHREISEFIKNSKANRIVAENRRNKKKKVKVDSV